MKLFVGSTNPIKINATTTAASEQWPDVEVVGYDVKSGVSEQPMTDIETKKGALNRAQAALKKGLSECQTNPKMCLGIGLEGGVFIDDKDVMWTTVWAAVIGQEEKAYVANGARFPVPKSVANRIRQGEEMGPIMADLYDGRMVKQQEGMIGVITKNFVDRTEEYMIIVKMVLGLWYGQDWEQHI